MGLRYTPEYKPAPSTVSAERIAEQLTAAYRRGSSAPRKGDTATRTIGNRGSQTQSM